MAIELQPVTTLPEQPSERTLGWELLGWAAEYLRQPDGPEAGEPFRFTREQALFLLWWFALDDQGRFSYRSGVFRRMKGHGKDPVGAALCAMELCAPTVPDGLDAAGNPVGRPHPAPWVQVAAVSREQTRNTLTLFPTMLSSELVAEFGLEIHKEIIHKKAGGRIEAVTSSPKALEGGRSHFVLLNETQFWLENNSGHEMENAIAGNVAKGRGGGARRLAICNAHVPGMESIAERDYDFHQELQAGTTKAGGFLYDAREAPPETDLYDEDSLQAGLIAARGDSTWLDVDRLIQEIYDPRTPVTESRRKYLNQVIAQEDSWLAPYEWDACRSDVTLQPGDRITLGFDGSKSGDHTALVACRISDAAVFLIKLWNPDDHGGEVPREQVNDTVRWCFTQYRVVGFRADVKEFESYVDQWAADFKRKLKIKATPKHPVGFDMRSNLKTFTLDVERFENAVLEGELAHDGTAVLRTQVCNAHRRPNNHGVSIGKASKDSSRKIDAAVCAVLAFGARHDFLMSTRNRGSGVVIFQ